MTAQAGALVLIKIGDGEVSESFTTLGGLRTSSIIVNNQLLETSNVSTGAWRQLQDVSGIRTVTITGTGLFTDSVSEEIMRGVAFNGNIHNYQFIFANGDSITGAFLVEEYERSGNIDDAETYRISLQSAGNISFAAV